MAPEHRCTAPAAALACAFLTLAAAAPAAILNVEADGSGQYPNIQAAIDAAVAGDTVLLGSGVYRHAVTRTLNGSTCNSVCFMKSDITLQGAGGPVPSVIDGQDVRHGICGEGLGPATVIRGVTVLDGKASGNGGNGVWGGGMLFHYSSPVVEDCVIRSCFAVGGGGMLFNGSHAGVGAVVRSCVFENNTSSDLGGALEIYLGALFTVENNTFIDNTALDRGGAAMFNATTGTVNNNIFYGNVAGEGGPALSCINSSFTGSCNLFWANSPGSDVQTCAVTIGSNGNLEADPLFCSVDTPDYRLQSTSPGAPAFSGGCGLIGALGVGCEPIPGGPGLRIPEIVGFSGAEVFVPVILDGNSPSGVRSYRLELAVDPAVLGFERVETAGTLSEGMLVVGNSPAPGVVLVAAAGVDPVGDNATLLTIVLSIPASVPDGTRAPVAFTDFVWGEGIPPSGLTDGGVTVGAGLTIGGHVTYYTGDPDPGPVPDIELSLSGDRVATTVSGADGAYSFDGLWLGSNVTIVPGTDAQDLSAVSSFDASLVLGHLVQVDTLDAGQLLAADVTGDGTMSPEDAARILRMIVDPGTIPDPLWLFEPPLREVLSLPEAQSDLDFTAMLRGDVSGNWCPAFPCPVPAREAVPAWSTSGAWSGSVFEIVVRVDEGGTRSLDFALTYDAARLTFLELDSAGGGLWTSFEQEGRISVAGATGVPWGEGQPVVTARFAPALSPPRRSEIGVGALRIDESAPQEAVVPVPGLNAPAGALVDFDLRISPNPARGAVELGIVGAAGPVRVQVFDVAGRRIRSFGATPDAAGARAFTWDRRDAAGARVADGIYFVRATDAERAVTRRVVLVQ